MIEIHLLSCVRGYLHNFKCTNKPNRFRDSPGEFISIEKPVPNISSFQYILPHTENCRTRSSESYKWISVISGLKRASGIVPDSWLLLKWLQRNIQKNRAGRLVSDTPFCLADKGTLVNHIIAPTSVWFCRAYLDPFRHLSKSVRDRSIDCLRYRTNRGWTDFPVKPVFFQKTD
jgi:hypothetical protein